MRARYTHLGKPGETHRDYQMHLCTLLYLRCLRMCETFDIGGLDDHLVLAWKPLTETKTYGGVIQIVNVPMVARLTLHKECMLYDSTHRLAIRSGKGDTIPLEDVRNVLYTNRVLTSRDDFFDSQCNIRGLLDSGGKCSVLKVPKGAPPAPVKMLVCHGQGNVEDLGKLIMYEITTDELPRLQIYQHLLRRVTHWWDVGRPYGHITEKSDIKFTTGFKRKLQVFPCKELGLLDDARAWGDKAVFLRAVAAAKVEEVREHVARGAMIKWKDDDGNGAVHLAAQADSAAVAEMLLDAGLDIEDRNDAGRTPLLVAASAGSGDVVKLLLRRDARIKARDTRRNCVVHLAAGAPKPDALKALVEHIKQLTDTTVRRLFDARNVISLTPFLQGAVSGMIENMRELLEVGAAEKAVDRHNLTALHLAVVNHHPDVVTFLLDRGASLEARSLRDMTPYLAAAGVGDVALLELLRGRGAGADVVDEASLNALHHAALQGYNDAVRYLVASGADVGGHAWDFRTALHFATSHGRLSTVRLLLQLGAEVEARDRAGATPLHLAAMGGYADILKALLGAGACVRTRNIFGGTALHEAATHGRLECARGLVEARAGVDVRTRDKRLSPLHCAASSGHLDVVEFLLFAGSYVHRRDGQGETALHMAVRGSHLKVAEALVAKGCGVNDLNAGKETPLHVASAKGNREVVAFLLQAGADIEAEDYFGRTPVNLAVQFGHVKVVRMLHLHDCNLNRVDRLGGTLLHTAAWFGHDHIAQFLLQRGLDANATDIFGSTPLHKAASNGHGDAFRVLLCGKADYGARNKEGQRPLDIAQTYDHDEVEELIIVMMAMEKPSTDQPPPKPRSVSFT